MTQHATLELDPIRLRTDYVFECWRPIAYNEHAHGWSLVWREAFSNLITTVGKNKILDAVFKSGEAANAWFLGLVNAAGFSAYAVGDTMAVHPGWAEATGYIEATRQAYVMGTIAAGSGGNAASKAMFNINAPATIRGGFLVDESTKSGATGTLYGVGDFTTPRAVLPADLLRVQATLSVL